MVADDTSTIIGENALFQVLKTVLERAAVFLTACFRSCQLYWVLKTFFCMQRETERYVLFTNLRYRSGHKGNTQNSDYDAFTSKK